MNKSLIPFRYWVLLGALPFLALRPALAVHPKHQPKAFSITAAETPTLFPECGLGTFRFSANRSPSGKKIEFLDGARRLYRTKAPLVFRKAPGTPVNLSAHPPSLALVLRI